MDLFSREARADDAALLAGYAAGDPAAGTAFVRRFQARVFGLALAVTRDQGLAEDVAQEAFVRAWRAAETFDTRRGTVAGWLLTITRNAAVDTVRARRPRPLADEVLERVVGATLAPDEPGRTPEAVDDRARARRLLAALPIEQSRAVVLAVVVGCTAKEISEREQIPLGTAKTRVRNGLRRLRAASEEVHRD